MARPHRHDAPDTWHHVLNRGLAKRTMFETASDCRMFLALVAREVRAGRLELHAYCLMANHFHLLVRSVTGELSKSMRLIQNGYSRYFNRTRKRDGPLVRGRFRSRWIDSLRYRRNVFGYIHDNAVKAGIARDRADYRWSSARDWQTKPPRWIARDWIEAELEAHGYSPGEAKGLDAVFPSRLDDDNRAWIERQLRARHEEETEDESLKHAASPRAVRWTIRKANLADGTRPWRPVCAASIVERVVHRARIGESWLARLLSTRSRRVLLQIRAGLLRMLAGCSHREIALRTGRHRGTVTHDLAEHRDRLARSGLYEKMTAKLARAVLAAVGV